MWLLCDIFRERFRRARFSFDHTRLVISASRYLHSESGKRHDEGLYGGRRRPQRVDEFSLAI